MARLHGQNGRIYLGVADSNATAEPIPFLSSWSMDLGTDKAEVTAFGDDHKIYVAGKPNATGEFSGFLDDSTAQTYAAALDGQPRKFYLYPSTNDTTKYFFGTILPDFSAEATVDGPIELSSSWSAASKIERVGLS